MVDGLSGKDLKTPSVLFISKIPLQSLKVQAFYSQATWGTKWELLADSPSNTHLVTMTDINQHHCHHHHYSSMLSMFKKSSKNKLDRKMREQALLDMIIQDPK